MTVTSLSSLWHRFNWRSCESVSWSGRVFFFQPFAGIWRRGWGGEFEIQNSTRQVVVPRVYCLLVNVQVILCLRYCKGDSLPLAFPTGRCPALAFTCCFLQAVGEFSKC